MNNIIKEKINDPLISVIIPCFNVEKYLEECIKSVVNQTYRNLEIICINDGSTDTTPSILNNLSKTDSRIKIITQNNMGLSSARNTGLDNMSGKWYTYIDSDDTFDLNFIEKLATNKNDEVLVTSDRCIWNGKIKKTNNISNNFKINKDYKGYSIGAWGKLYTSNKKVYFTEGLIFEDIVHFFETLKKYEKEIFEFSVCYNLRRESGNNNITSKKRSKKEYLDTWNEVSKHYNEYPFRVYKYAILIFKERKEILWTWTDKRFYKSILNINNKTLNQKVLSFFIKIKLYFVVKLILIITLKKRKFDA